MYIDFHYYMIKVLAIKAGFDKEEAEDIAYASEYVDDALEFLPMQILNPPDFTRNLVRKDGRFDVVCTAHDEQTMLGGALVSGQERTYVPFHFIPRDDASAPADTFDFRTAPNCPTARGLVEAALGELNGAAGELRSRKLIKLGIALHTYADTWAHKDFSGLYQPEHNSVENIQIFKDGQWSDMGVDTMPAIVPETGHAKAHALPDSSHARWRYYNGVTREYFERNNPEIYLEAAATIHAVLCRATGCANRWNEIEGRVRQCIEHVPAVPIWERRGLNEKIQVYLDVFPEIFTGSFKAEEYDERLWKTRALQPFILEDGKRQDLAFTDDIFQMRELISQWGKQIRQHAQRIADDGKLKFLFDSAKNSFVGGVPGLLAGVVGEAMNGVEEWFHRYSAIQYELNGQHPASRKWFYFHVEAEAQRIFILQNTHLRYDRDEQQASLDYVADKLPNLRQQLTSVLINCAERFVAPPSQHLTERSYWMSVHIQNDSPYQIVWKGSYNGDFDLSNCSGRYWDRPDKFGDIRPDGHAVFTACEKNNAQTGCSGVAPFAIVLDNGAHIPFHIGFSNPIFDDALHAGKRMGAKAVETFANAPSDLWNAVRSVTEKIGVDLPHAPTVEIKVQKSPKCRVAFETDRQRTYDALDDGAQVEHSQVYETAGRKIKLTAYPGQEARVVVSLVA